MRVLISSAVWGKSYCSVFTKYSLATLLSGRNIPALAQQATITCHIVTRRSDRELLLNDPAVIKLQRYCTIEWELIENFGFFKPPEGAGGEKYPFLSALQNIAITRSVDYDAIIFNYADFVWADGSLTTAVEKLMKSPEVFDAVFAFCLPVDRDSAMPALERHRQTGSPEIIMLALRDGAKIAVEHMHREAKVRFWDHPRFTVTPSYLMWRVDDHGVVIRAYHQSILAMRVRPDDAQYLRGIVRGSLDSSFAAQLASRTSLAFATDSDSILVFSLYHTPIDSRLPPGVTHEMSLRSLLQGDVTLEQRRLAERPIFLRLRDGNEADWTRVAEESWSILRRAQETTAFDQAFYDRNLATHGVVPRITRLNAWHLKAIGANLGWLSAALLSVDARIRLLWSVFARRELPHGAIVRSSTLAPAWNTTLRIWSALRQPSLLRSAIKRRLRRLQAVVGDQLDHHVGSLRMQILRSRGGFAVAPNTYVDSADMTLYAQALDVEGRTTEIVDAAHLTSLLRGAEGLLRETIKSVPVWAAPVQALGRNLWFQGRFKEAMQTFTTAEQLRDVMAWMAGWPVNSCVFLPRNCAESIGLMGHLDAFTKHKILTADPRRYYLLAPPHQIVNSAFLDYWRDHISIVSEPREIEKLAELETVYGVNWNWVLPKDGAIVFVHAGMAAVHRTWEKAGRAPLLSLRTDHAAALRVARSGWGMTDADRFVCLHIRSAGFYGEAREKAQLFRNTVIDDYYPLIRALTDMGLWVVRMGDSSMPPLDLAHCGTPQRVVDYALSPQKSAELDVALCATCELFVSTILSTMAFLGIPKTFSFPSSTSPVPMAAR